ncbi:MAG TPA: NAD-dependent epimerase/dehydratase family protein [Bryobacteraceae bacterium]
MKRVLVTGASGFVGANLVRRLLKDGHETHLLLRPSHQSWRLEEIIGDVRGHASDLEDDESVRRVVTAVKPDWVFHLAAYGAYPNQTGLPRMVATNLMGCAALVAACVETGVESFVHTGSSSEYGFKDHAATEDEVLEPNSHYAITKAAATHYCQCVARERNLNAVTLRLYSIYGPFEEPGRLIPTLIRHGLRGVLPPLATPGTARDFVYVDDAVDAMLQVAATPSIQRGAIYNICTGVQSTLADVVAVARKLMKISAEPVWSTMPDRSWDTDRWVGSPHRIKKEIGWRAQTTLEEGLAKTLRWFVK